MEKIDYFTAFYGTEETEQKLKIAARSDEWTAILGLKKKLCKRE